MEASFWRERWRRNEIGFHQPSAHVALDRHWAALGLRGDERVLVPLAGKSLDMIWLARAGHEVVGIELAAEAVEAFEREQPAAARARVDLRCRDIFETTRAELGRIDAVFDRAALVALPPLARRRYAAHLTALTSPGTPTLLVTLEYDQSRMAGPPHSVPELEVHELYGAAHRIERLARDEALADFPKFAQRGLERIAEVVYLLRRR